MNGDFRKRTISPHNGFLKREGKAKEVGERGKKAKRKVQGR